MNRCLRHQDVSPEPEVVSMTLAAPGWNVAMLEFDGVVTLEPIVAWGQIRYFDEFCGCERQRVSPLIVDPELFEIAPVDLSARIGTLEIVPPGRRVGIHTVGSQRRIHVLEERVSIEAKSNNEAAE
jgi:hypothetical protein